MTDSITVTREQVEEVMLEWLAHEGVALSAGVLYREHQAKSFAAALFNNVKAGSKEDRCPYCGGSPYHEANVCRESGYQQPDHVKVGEEREDPGDDIEAAMQRAELAQDAEADRGEAR